MKYVRKAIKGITAEIAKVSHSHYTMNYLGNYGLEEYLTKGVKNVEEYLEFIDERLLMDTVISYKIKGKMSTDGHFSIQLGIHARVECGPHPLNPLPA